MIKHFTYGRYHGKKTAGSTRLRIYQLEKYWPEFSAYKYGENPDVMVWQKVYIQEDWRFMEHLEGMQILDICDPDWLDHEHVKQTIDCMDGVTCPTEPLAEFLRQLSDKPVKVIPDRHDLELLPKPKVHRGKLTKAGWFGYSQNADILKSVLPVLEKRGIELTIISNEDIHWLGKHQYKRFDEETIGTDLQEFDVIVFPQGTRPQDRFKSNNKTTLAWLCGLPVVKDVDELDAMMEAKDRNEYVKTMYPLAVRDYDVRQSVKEMQQFIIQLQDTRTNA